MEEELKERIRQMAAENGLDPEEVLRHFSAEEVPDGLMQAMTHVLGAVDSFVEEQKDEE